MCVSRTPLHTDTAAPESKARQKVEAEAATVTMSQFWKPGTEKPRLLDDEEGGVLFLAASPSSSRLFFFCLFTSAIVLPTLSSKVPFLFVYIYIFSLVYCLYLILADWGIRVSRNRGRGFLFTSTEPPFSIWWRPTPLRLLLVKLVAGKPPRFHRFTISSCLSLVKS